MERLTYDFAIGGRHCWEVHGADNLLCSEVCKNQGDKGCEDCPLRKAIDRLAAYEETGLEPGDIDALQKREQGLAEMLVNVSCGCAVPYTRLAELAQAEKDGRLVVLPCKAGDTVWTNIAIVEARYKSADRPYPVEVVFIGIGEDRGFFQVQYSNGRVFPFDFDKFGKTVFLTREEAEAALKKREEDNEAD